MYELNDLLLLLNSSQPVINIQTHEEQRAVDLVKRCSLKLNKRILQWSVTKGIVDANTGAPALSLSKKHVTTNIETASDPKNSLIEIANCKEPGIYILLDFHPYMDDPFVIRSIKEIAQDYTINGHHIVFVSHELEIPSELSRFTAQFAISLPDKDELRRLIISELKVWKLKNTDEKLQADKKSIELLINNLTGLTVSEAKRLIRNAIYDDDAISHVDIEQVQKAKYELLGQNGVLSFEYETATFGQIGGLKNLKQWLEIRQAAFSSSKKQSNLDKPKGILLVGIQGSGKSLAAKAVAGVWHVPLLRLDFGVLYNKFFGETEKNIRHALELAEVMAPCVLWIDEIEKGISTGDYDSGTSQRLLATFLTWMAENEKPVFIVATANDIQALPPELIRKGRLDEIFFVDLPDEATRAEIFSIHLKKREVDPANIDVNSLATMTEGFSGAEIEQAIVSALYHAFAEKQELSLGIIVDELNKTQPLSVVMREQIAQLQDWAKDRTVSAN
ncbi:MAG: AAA family ATPase [Pseudomonadales bacterium]|nr:AAA family ATPase [Pseudomonadales bacterium]